MVAGDRLTDARPGFNSRTNEPIVTFRFDSVGAREFGNVTKENVGRRFAIVLDNKVISAPVIQDADSGRFGSDLRQLHTCRAPTIWPCCCAPVRCRRR